MKATCDSCGQDFKVLVIWCEMRTEGQAYSLYDVVDEVYVECPHCKHEHEIYKSGKVSPSKGEQ